MFPWTLNCCELRIFDFYFIFAADKMGNFTSGLLQFVYQRLLESREKSQERVSFYFNQRLQEAAQDHRKKTEQVLLGSEELVAHFYTWFLCRGIKTSVKPHPDVQRRQLLDYFDKRFEEEKLHLRKQERLALHRLGLPTSRL
eukprot:Skav230720  [mRNA]  locus=scaffold715:262442:262867:- [translate_table: standard]